MTQLKQVAIGRSANPSGGFPFCRFYLVGIASEQADNKPSDYRTYRYAIEIMQEISNKTKQTAEEDFEDAIDAVLDRLNANWQLGNNADQTEIDVSSVVQMEANTGPCAVLTIFFSVKTLIY